MNMKNFKQFLNEKFDSDSLKMVLSNFRSDMDVASNDKHDIQSAQEETIASYIEKYPQFEKEIKAEFEKSSKEELDRINNLTPLIGEPKGKAKGFNSISNNKLDLLKGDPKSSKSSKSRKIDETYNFDFEDWQDTDISGPGCEMEIDNLIEEYKNLITKEIEKEATGTGVDIERAKNQAAKEISSLWIEKIKKDFKF